METAATTKRKAIVFASIQKFFAKRYARKDIEHGSQHHVTCTINAKIRGERSPVNETFVGTLSVGHPGTQNSSHVPTAEIIASLLAEIPKEQRPQLLKKLSAEFAKTKTIKVTKSLAAEAETWLTTLRSKTSTPRAASISFTADT